MTDEPVTSEPQPDAPAVPADWKAELQKIIDQRDKAKAEARTLREKSVLAETERQELESLRQAKADAEEKRKLEAGDFESAKAAILKEKDAAEARAKEQSDRYARKVVEAAFSSATDLFGPTGLTTLTPEFAFAGMSRHVDFVPGENGAPDRMIVRDLHGEQILGADGNPAPFAEGLRKLIDQWPGKEQILRSGVTAGSGSTGGSGEAVVLPVERAELVARANEGDPVALKALRASQPKPRMVIGPHFQKQTG